MKISATLCDLSISALRNDVGEKVKMKSMAFKITRCLFMVMVTFVVVNPAFAHKNHSPYSTLIADPLITHHALIEDEQRLNYFFFKNRRFQQQIGNGLSVELAYAMTDYFGVEIFIPVLSSDSSGSTLSNLGDIEIHPLKLSFYSSSNLVMTGVLGLVLPTGDEAKGFGNGSTIIEPHFYVDVVLGGFLIQGNVAYGRTVSGAAGSELEYSFFFSRPFYKNKHGFLPLVELNGGRTLSGLNEGGNSLYVTPGFKYTVGGWHIGAGVQLPVTDNRTADWIGLLQWGFHFGL